MIEEITAEHLKYRMYAKDAPTVVDVRERTELDIGRLDFARNIPYSQLADRLHELDAALPVVIICRSGNRAPLACKLLLNHGFHSVSHVTGGMLAWVERVDPTMRPSV
ncbi:MAG: rhodanese-like domain-containing protein [Sinobacteraceae bacterium]|nr:rhodanese-like domain-containing protein [Nevskiaceae bacterium]